MLRFLTSTALDREPCLRDSMLRDRAAQFRDRMGWPVQVDAEGRERDAYDDEGPTYVLWERPDGTHGGSARFLPTTGRTMVNDHFAHLAGARLVSPLIWECTRFCLAPGADRRVAPAIMLGGAEIMRALALTHLIGVFDDRMTRAYALIGATPEVLGSEGGISVGLWHEDRAMRRALLLRSGLGADDARRAWEGREAPIRLVA